MRAIVQKGYGGPEVLHMAERPRPIPKPDELLVRIHTTVATPSEVACRTGDPWIARLFSGLISPRIPILGDNFAGVVEQAGAAVSRFAPGERVFGSTGLVCGAYAEFQCVAEDGAIAAIPAGLSFGEAAGLADGGLTALPFLRDVGALKAGQRVLINAASGSVGSVAVQLARHFGAEVTGVCSRANAALVEELGADQVIDYGMEDFTTRTDRYNLIFDAVGKSSFSRCRGALTAGGIYMSTVPTVPLLLQMLLTRGNSKRAIFAATGLRPPAAKAADLLALTQLVEAGKLRVVVDRRYTLANIAEAHAYVEQGHKIGSVVIDVG